ncbi:HAMP domain-containing histidine kinase [Microbispora sp. NBC_01189]|uniref:sensor histidine kinase n=1 Tax=Microbispora sp. NBC_01189 TaxID=2903583 RepID=UPI002E12B54B|nr:HAMP domain-containing histidine kinase [Microbispora sp. NBC_01189]
MTDRRCSIRTRLTMIAGMVMAVIYTALAGLILVVLRESAAKSRTERLVTDAVRFLRHARTHGPWSAPRPDISGTAIQVFTPSGAQAMATPDLAGRPPIVNFRPDPDSHVIKTLCDLPAFPGRCRIVIDIPYHVRGDMWRLYMAAPDVPWYVSPGLLGSLIACWLLLLAFTAWGAHRIVGKTLAPVHAISAKLATIAASDLGERVPVPESRDELRHLAETANQALARAQAAVQRQLRFASDTSHDLRSPLAAMRTELEDALAHPEDTDWPDTGKAVLGSVERLQALVADLLQLCRLDAGVSGRNDPVDLTGLVRDELDRRPRKVTVVERFDAAVVVDGDRIGLARLLTNLLDNAERHAVSSITVTVGHHDGSAVLTVTDDGEGIAPDQREVVFHRFVRLAASRARDADGSGLGLPIARQIAEAHGGTLVIEDSERGARFVLRIPIPPPRQSTESP